MILANRIRPRVLTCAIHGCAIVLLSGVRVFIFSNLLNEVGLHEVIHFNCMYICSLYTRVATDEDGRERGWQQERGGKGRGDDVGRIVVME